MNFEAPKYQDHHEVKSKLIDPFAREINYLRLSVTDRCDFRCLYCMSENMQFLPKKDLLTLEELDYMCSTFIKLGVKKLRVTGGEPLVRRDIMKFFRRVFSSYFRCLDFFGRNSPRCGISSHFWRKLFR